MNRKHTQACRKDENAAARPDKVNKERVTHQCTGGCLAFLRNLLIDMRCELFGFEKIGVALKMSQMGRIRSRSYGDGESFRWRRFEGYIAGRSSSIWGYNLTVER